MKLLFVSCALVLAFVAAPTMASSADSDVLASAEPIPESADTLPEAGPTKRSLLSLDSKSLDVYVDVLLVNDISGRTDGVYEDANALLLSAIERDIRQAVPGDVLISDVLLANGSLLDEDKKLVYANRGKATATEFKGHATSAGEDVPLAESSAEFFRDVMMRSAEGKRRGTHFDVALPDSELYGSSRYLLFVQASSRHVPFGKTLAIGTATGMLTGLSIMPMSGASATIALIDKQESKVLWAMQRTDKGFNQLRIMTMKLVRSFGRALPAETELVPPAIELDSSAGFKNLREAKLALRAEKITKTEYYAIAAELQQDYRDALTKLRQREKSGEISEAALEILSIQAELDYSGG